MKTELIISLVLLGLILLDAIGDALRFRSKQIAHHVMEVIHISGWIALWALFSFQWLFLPMYIMGRIVLFDIVFNLSAGLSIGHIGKSSLYDIVLTWFGGWVKQHPAHFVFIFRFMALIVWIGLLIRLI